jgi:hypothetical protein
VQQSDHRAGGLADDLVDQLKRMLRVRSQPHQRDIGSLQSGHRPHVLDFDLPRDHLMTERGYDRGNERQAILALVCDQNA